MASHPDYEELDQLSNDLAIATNPHVHYNTRQLDVPVKEQKAIQEIIKDRLGNALLGGRFRDWVNEDPFNKLK